MTSNRLKASVYDQRWWKKLRRQIIERDGRCRWAGCTERRPSKLTVHHLRPNGGEDPSNLVTLCRHHHGVIDGPRSRGGRA